MRSSSLLLAPVVAGVLGTVAGVTALLLDAAEERPSRCLERRAEDPAPHLLAACEASAEAERGVPPEDRGRRGP